tara:strand:- start:78 stop:1064 length:987 start_codon:yes stop_codon:yes gene_type:complete
MKQRNFQDDYERINPKLKKHFFSAQPTITSTYAGELALPYLAAALKSGKTLANNWIKIKENIPYKAVLKNVAQANIIQNGACDWNEAGTTTLDERVLTVEEFMVNLELCKADFRQDWEAAATGSMFDDRIPPTFEEFLLSYVADQVAQQIENTIWGGNNAAAGEFEGFATNAGIIVSGGGSNITAGQAFDTPANTLLGFSDLLTGIAGSAQSAILDKEDFAIYCSPKVALFYAQSLANSGYLNEYQVGDKPMNYMGYQVLVCPGMLNDRLIAAQKSNLVFGTNLMTDMTNIRVIDRSLIDGSDNVRMSMRYAAGIQAGVIAETFCCKV